MKTQLLLIGFFVLALSSAGLFAGEVKNSKLTADMQESSQQHQDALVGHTQKWTAKFAKWYQENVVVPQQEAEALGLNPGMCFLIKNEDAKTACSASINANVRQNESYCGIIKDSDSRADCIASVRNDANYCGIIRDNDSRNACMAAIQQNESQCGIIRDNDSRAACIAGVKHEKSWCGIIKSEDARHGCLAGFPR